MRPDEADGHDGDDDDDDDDDGGGDDDDDDDGGNGDGNRNGYGGDGDDDDGDILQTVDFLLRSVRCISILRTHQAYKGQRKFAPSWICQRSTRRRSPCLGILGFKAPAVRSAGRRGVPTSSAGAWHHSWVVVAPGDDHCHYYLCCQCKHKQELQQ